MVTTPNCLFDLHVSASSFQIYLLHHFSRDWGEADQSLASHLFFLLIILDVRSDICFLPLRKNCSPWPFRGYQVSSNGISRFPQLLWVQPIRFQGLIRSGLFKYSLNWSFSRDRKSSLPCILQWPQVPGIPKGRHNQWRLRKRGHCQLSHVLCHQVPCPVGPPFP